MRNFSNNCVNFYSFGELCHFYLVEKCECFGMFKGENNGLQKMSVALVILMLQKGKSNQ